MYGRKSIHRKEGDNGSLLTLDLRMNGESFNLHRKVALTYKNVSCTIVHFLHPNSTLNRCNTVYTRYMQSKRIIWLFALVGGWIGGYLPALWGSAGLTFLSILFNAIGGLIGIWIGFKLTR